VSAPPYMRLYWGDYFRDTRRLSLREHGAYLLLLGELWVQGGKLPADDDTLARAALCTPAEWAEMRPTIMPFFRVVRGKLTQKRLAEELAKYDDTIRKRKLAGQKGGKATRGNGEENTEANAKHLPTKPEPEPEPKKIDEPTVHCPAKPYVVSLNDDFKRAWKAFPALGRQRSKSQAKTLPIWREAAKLAGGGDRLAGAVFRYVREDQTHKGECGAPAFDRWLRDGRWEHWLPEANAPSGASGLDPALLALHQSLMNGTPANA